jgi:hypothetical protein
MGWWSCLLPDGCCEQPDEPQSFGRADVDKTAFNNFAFTSLSRSSHYRDIVRIDSVGTLASEDGTYPCRPCHQSAEASRWTHIVSIYLHLDASSLHCTLVNVAAG